MNYKKIGAKQVFKEQCELLMKCYADLYDCFKYTEGGNVPNNTFAERMKFIEKETEKLKSALEEYKSL